MKYIYTLLLSSLCFSGFGQSNLESSNKLLPSITRPSPTVSQLMKVEESSLDHYTGQPQISVPLFSTKAGNLDVNLTLSYNSSGIRIAEQSGWTGKGWTLETGGVISRSVVDLPDEIDTPLMRGTNQSDNYYHNFFDYAPDSDERKNFTYDAQWGARVDVDSKNDIYQFNFFGRTGRFVFAKIGNVLKPAIIGNDGNYKIESFEILSPGPFYPKEIGSFVITDDMGYRYYFTEIERTEKKDVTFVYMQEGCDSPVAPSEPVNIGKFISAWHLSKVEDTNGIRLLDITYTNVLEKPMTAISTTEYVAKNLQDVFSANNPSCTPSMKCALKPSKISSQPFREIQSKKISSISFPDGSNIQFSISANHPEYREGKGAYLTGITIYNGKETSPIRTFNFSYSTSNALFLDSVKTNNSDTEKYTFDYYNRPFYPDFDTYERDIFGYASSVAMQTGVLSKITYPTKGVREFTWEPNTYSYKGDRLLSFVEIFNNPDNYTTSGVSHDDPFMNYHTTRPYALFQVNFEQDAFVYSSTTYPGTEVFTMPNFIMIVPVLDAPGNPVDTNRVDAGYPIGTNQIIDRTVHLKPGLYKVYFRSLNLTLSDTEKISGSIDIMVKNPTSTLNWFLYGGGVRINTAKDSDRAVDQIIKGYTYNFENPGIVPADLPPYLISPNGSYTLNFSSGSFDGSDRLVRDYIVSIAPIYNLPGQIDNPVEYHVFEKQNELDAQLQKGSFIGYKNVFEYFYPNVSSIHNPIYKSKIKYIFDSPIDFPSDITISYPPLPVRGEEYKQGNVRKIDYFGSGTGLVVSEDFKYNYDTGNIKTFVKKNVYFLSNENSISDFCQRVRVLYTSYYNLKNNIITAYQYAIDCTGQPSALAQSFQQEDKSACLEELSSIYSYMSIDDFRYKSQVVEHTKKEYLPTVALESKETYSYRNDYKRLFTQTSLSSTGETLTTKYFYPPDGEMSSAPYRTELIAKNIIGSPLRTEVFRNSELLSVQETHYGSFALPTDSPTPPLPGNALLPQYIYTAKGTQPIEKRITFSSYDSRGNITQYVQQNGPATSFVWGYGKTLPLAKIENIAYTNIPTGLITTAQGLSNANPLSYDEGLLLNALENLRTDNALAGSMVTTYAYKPLIGISATIDVKGERTTYFYDSFGRLKAVKDDEGKMLSQNSYHYRTQN